MTALVFQGQGAQYEGMGADITSFLPDASNFYQEVNDLMGFDMQQVMTYGTAEELKQTKVTQPAIFLHSVAKYIAAGKPTAVGVAGHSLGEFSALVAAGVFDWQTGLKLVYERALAMQEACDNNPGTMAAILGLEDEQVEDICEQVDSIVVAANYNCPGQLVISGSLNGVEAAMALCKEAGAKRALLLPVGGAFHSPLMGMAKTRLSEAIEATIFHTPTCPIYQNVNAMPATDPAIIQRNLKDQLTGAVRWTQTIKKMTADGITLYKEVGGTGKVLTGLIRKIEPEATSETL